MLFHPPKRLIVAGLRRTGSTWLFNVLRIMFSSKYEICAKFLKEYDKKNSKQVHVIKAHKHDDVNGTVFVTIRDPRDMVASAVRRNMIHPKWKDVQKFLNGEYANYNAWKPKINNVLRYEEFSINKVKAIENISLFLQFPCDCQMIHNQVEALVPKQEYDPISMLWPNHISDKGIGYYKTFLDRDLIERIEREFALQIRELGYD